LQFSTAAVPDTAYVFDGESVFAPFGPYYSGPPTTEISGYVDIDSGDGRCIGSGVSFGLVTLTFDNSDPSPPSGLFFIELVPSQIDEASFYVLSSSPTDAINFDNAQPVVGSVQVGAESQAVPEAATNYMAVVGALFLLIWFVTARAIGGRGARFPSQQLHSRIGGSDSVAGTTRSGVPHARCCEQQI
jgi:hypothetical protein